MFLKVGINLEKWFFLERFLIASNNFIKFLNSVSLFSFSFLRNFFYRLWKSLSFLYNFLRLFLKEIYYTNLLCHSKVFAFVSLYPYYWYICKEEGKFVKSFFMAVLLQLTLLKMDLFGAVHELGQKDPPP